MSDYAIISLGGKQYVVREGQSLLVDRLDREEGKTFEPDVLFVGGGGAGELAPSVSVTAQVVSHERGPKVRIGKYKAKSGYKRHNGFRAALTRIEVTGIGGGRVTEQKAAAPVEADAPAEAEPEAKATNVPEGYPDMTVTQIAEASNAWTHDEIDAALAYEREHADRKGAVAALESAQKKDD